MVRSDLPSVVDIELHCEGRLNRQQILSLLSERNHVAHVAEHRVTGEVIGWHSYALTASTIDLTRFGVHPEWRCQGVGSEMLRGLRDRMSHTRRARLISYVDERALDLQLFLSRRGFVARNVIGLSYLMEFKQTRRSTNVSSVEAQR